MVSKVAKHEDGITGVVQGLVKHLISAASAHQEAGEAPPVAAVVDDRELRAEALEGLSPPSIDLQAIRNLRRAWRQLQVGCLPLT